MNNSNVLLIYTHLDEFLEPAVEWSKVAETAVAVGVAKEAAVANVKAEAAAATAVKAAITATPHAATIAGDQPVSADRPFRLTKWG